MDFYAETKTRKENQYATGIEYGENESKEST